MKTLIVGYGEIGQGLTKVLSKKYSVRVIDPYQENIPKHLELGMYEEDFEIMHVCIPPIKDLEKVIKQYQRIFEPKYTVIHSSFAVGTAKKLGCFHSPVRGIHPHIAEGIQTFVKYLAPKNKVVSNYFRKAGIKIKEVADTDTTEALKLWDTTVYGVNIMLEKEIYEWCQKHKVDFDLVYTDSALTYNEGYQKLGHPEYKKYILKHMQGGIGGHCVINNIAFLKDSPLARLLNKKNEEYKMSKMQTTPRKSR